LSFGIFCDNAENMNSILPSEVCLSPFSVKLSNEIKFSRKKGEAHLFRKMKMKLSTKTIQRAYNFAKKQVALQLAAIEIPSKSCTF